MDFSLYVISHVGMIISLVCLVLAIATFLLCQSIRNHITYLHLHLCVCLLLAQILFLAGIDKTDNQVYIAGAVSLPNPIFSPPASAHSYPLPSTPVPTSGPLHRLCPLPVTLTSQLLTCLTPCDSSQFKITSLIML